MNRAEVLAIIRPWHARTVELQRQWDAFESLTGARTDHPFANAIWLMHEDYTRAISKQIGDENDWLGWWHYECQLGRKPQKAFREFGHKEVTVSTLQKLATVIMWGKE